MSWSGGGAFRQKCSVRRSRVRFSSPSTPIRSPRSKHSASAQFSSPIWLRADEQLDLAGPVADVDKNQLPLFPLQYDPSGGPNARAVLHRLGRPAFSFGWLEPARAGLDGDFGLRASGSPQSPGGHRNVGPRDRSRARGFCAAFRGVLLPASSGGSQCRIARQWRGNRSRKTGGGARPETIPARRAYHSGRESAWPITCLVVNLKNRNILVKALRGQCQSPTEPRPAVGRLLACHRPAATNASGCSRADFCRRGVNRQVFPDFKREPRCGDSSSEAGPSKVRSRGVGSGQAAWDAGSDSRCVGGKCDTPSRRSRFSNWGPSPPRAPIDPGSFALSFCSMQTSLLDSRPNGRKMWKGGGRFFTPKGERGR